MTGRQTSESLTPKGKRQASVGRKLRCRLFGHRWDRSGVLGQTKRVHCLRCGRAAVIDQRPGTPGGGLAGCSGFWREGEDQGMGEDEDRDTRAGSRFS